MTELESFLQGLKERGTRLTVEREKLPMYTGAPVFHYRFWMCGPVWPADFAKLHRFKPELISYLVGAGRFEMSTGDTQTPSPRSEYTGIGRKPNPLLTTPAQKAELARRSSGQEVLAEVRVALPKQPLIPDTPPRKQGEKARSPRIRQGGVVINAKA